MEEKTRWTTCRWCGAELGPDEDWMEGKNITPAVWCPDCDGLTFLNPADDKRKMTLILEHRKTQMEFAPQTQGKKRTQLRKRLSPLRYPGGKSKVIDELYESLDEERLDTFVELFAGGASFGLSLLEAGKTRKLILNDADPCVANFWRAATQFTDDLIDEINAEGKPTPNRFYQYRSELNELREAYLSGEERSILSVTDAEWCVQKVARFLIVNRLSFGGLQASNLLGGANGKRPLLNLSISSTALFLARISSSHMTMCRKSGTCTRMRMLKDLVLSGLCSEPIKDFLLMTVYFKGWDSDKEKITELITEKE